MSNSSWVSNGTNVAYEPKEKNTGEVITSFSTTAPGGVPNSSYAPSTYVLAASGAWIAQTVATAASEVRRPSVYTELTGNPSPNFIATNTNLVYDADANHISTYGAFELAGLQVQNDASFTYTVFQTKAQTWTSCTLNISRNYASTQWTSGTEARFYLSTDSGSNWTLLLTDDYDSDPITVAIFSHTLSTVNPSSLSAYQVKVEIDAFPSSAFNSVGVLYLQLYDIWIEGIYAVSGGSGTVTSITTTGANGVTISGGSTQTITTSGTFALALGAITPTSIATGTGSFSGDVEFAASIKSPTNSPVTIAPDGTGDVHLNTDSVRIGDNNADATLHTRGTGDLIITTHEGSANEGIVRLYDGANGNITLTPNGTGQVKVGTDQVVTLVASQTLTNKTISGSSNTLSNIANASLTNSTISGVALGSNLNALTISSPLTGTSFNGSSAVSIGIPVATTSVNGYLSSTDWTTFNNKGSGSVTSVAATVPSLLSISGSPITTSGTLAITYSGTALPVANGGTGLTTLTAGYIPYGAGTSAFGSSANLFWDSANSYLGIGTASPGTKLTVNSGSSGADSARFTDGVNSTLLVKHSSGGIASLDAYSTFTLMLGGSEQMRLNSTGLGIGTASPNYKLDVNGAIVNGINGAYGAYTRISGGTLKPYFATSGNDTFYYNTNASGSIKWVNATDTATLMTLDNSGNVGIGTASPSQKLTLGGQTGASATPLALQFSADWSDGYVASKSKIYLYNNGGSGVWGFAVGPDNDIQYHSGGATNTNGQHKWYSGNVEFMRLNASGNLGIGTASPGYKLDVNGTTFTTGITISTGGGTNVANTVNIDTNGSGTARYYSHGSNSSTKGSHEFHLASSNGSLDVIGMSLDTSGNLTNTGVFKGNSGTKGFGGITTTTSTSTPTGGSSGDHYYIY